MKHIGASNFQQGLLYPVVSRAVAELLKTRDVIAPVELLLHLQRITKAQYEDWRMGRIPCLEQVCSGNPSKLNRLLRILDHHARALGLKPSHTAYHRWGKGRKQVLRFSKSGDPNLEAAYSRHYVKQAMPQPGQPDPEMLEQKATPQT